jgi:L-rhamnose mutarotase
MERRAFLIHIYPGTEAEYDRRHDEIWPEMESALSNSGFTNYSLFRSGTTVIGYLECIPNVATAGEKMSETETSARWNDFMKDVIDPVATQSAPKLVEVWHLKENS